MTKIKITILVIVFKETVTIRQRFTRAQNKS